MHSLENSVLLLSPTHTINFNSSAASKPLSPLEITAMAAEDVFPGAAEPFAAILFPGVVIKEVSRVFGNCYIHGKGSKCDWNRITQFKRLWKEAIVTKASREQWRRASGPHYSLMSAVCAVISLGGLSGFWVPVKMTLVGLVALIIALYLTPSCSILPNLLLMTFLSEWLPSGSG